MPEYHQTNQINSLSTNKPINNNFENLYDTDKPITQALNQSGSTNQSRQPDSNMNLVNQLGNYINNFNSYTNQSYNQQQNQQYNLQAQAPQPQAQQQQQLLQMQSQIQNQQQPFPNVQLPPIIPNNQAQYQNQYTTLSNANPNNQSNIAALSRNQNFLRSLNVPPFYENLQNSKNTKANKIANSDGDNSSKIYGNALLGPNLWDKNDLFQGEKLGVKFEYLDIDEFLNENGLNEADVEFLDQLQNNGSNPNKPNQTVDVSLANASSLPSQNTNAQQGGAIQTSISPAASSLSSVSSPSSSITSSSSPNRAPINFHDALSSPNVNLSSQAPISSNQIPRVNTLASQKSVDYRAKEKLIHENIGSISSEGDSMNYWNANNNDLSLDSMSDYDDYSDMTRKLSDDDLRPQPLLKKSKKQFVPNELKDDRYWARRRKNNMAAKRSRDARRMKENQIALRASYLERENDSLRKQLEDFKRETKLLKVKIARYEAIHPNLDIINLK
jgi:hepatic leukemia factor